jgi:hypothetical protein
MGLFDRFRRIADNDQPIRQSLVGLVLGLLRDRNGRIRVEDAISVAATIVGERCIDAAGEFSLRDHELTPGSRVFSTRANELICGDISEGGVNQIPTDSVVGVLRARLDSRLYSDAEFPDIAEVFRQFAARIGDTSDWGKVPLSVHQDHLPDILPLKVGYETRVRVDDILSSVRDNKAKSLRIATEALAEILAKVASTIDHKVALTLAIETINGMAKTAPMVHPKHLFVGGLVAMGFDATGKYLLTVSHSGRGVFFTETWERVARDTALAYPTDGKAVGIGPIDGQVIGVEERNERRDRIEMRSPDGRFHLIGESDGIIVT